MTLLFSNNAEAVLTNEIYPGDEVFLVVSDGSENMFRSPQLASPPGAQLATLTHPSHPGEYEVIRITSRTGNEFTVERGVERINALSDHPEIDNPENMTGQGAARYWPAGTKMSARVTAGTLAAVATGQGVVSRENSVILGVSVAADEYKTGAVSSSQSPYSLVFEGRSRVGNAIQLSGFPVLQLENFAIRNYYGTQSIEKNMSYPSIGGSFPVDLGAPQTFSAPASYARGSVVVPTTPNGFQYWLEIDSIDVSQVEPAAEPDWEDTDEYSLAVEVTYSGNAARWRPTAMPIEFEQNTYHPLVITEVGFIAHKVTATTPPSVSIGTAAVPGRFASNVALSQITGDGCIHRIPITTGGVFARELHFKLDTAASGGQFLGRFYWRGFFVELME